MSEILELRVSPEVAGQEELLREEVASAIGLQVSDRFSFYVDRRSIDARSRQVKVNLKIIWSSGEESTHRDIEWQTERLSPVKDGEPVIIVGAGPAGMFAALQAIELGVKPIVLERGKDVRDRRRDLAAINKEHVVNPESNYCFGEGGAGTYSDGKLYTRSKKRGDIRRILEILVGFGATEDILIDAHPHIGTNKLPKIIAAIRTAILDLGGEFRFGAKVTDFIIHDDQMQGVVINNEERLTGMGVVLATGHSARDIFELLYKRKVHIEAKPFALGLRVEHAQSLIDQIQYRCATDRGAYLPAASYSLVHQAKIKGEQVGVFSFCMCPGGFIVPSATSQEEVVVNGMSPSKRNSLYSNSGIVVAVNGSDFKKYEADGPLAGLRFQQEIERQAWLAGGKTQTAPAQRLVDFVKGRTSSSLLDTSYQPGLQSVDMRAVLPGKIHTALQQGFQAFGKKMRGYLTNEAQVVGVESRTSSPVMVPRDKESLEHVQIKRLYPCGEGAGYAGGIVSAAMDGERCVKALIAAYATS